MNNFNKRGGSQGGFRRPSFGGRDGRDRGPVTMHKATCAECGDICEVPFRPTGDKPVYCSNCFGSKRDGGDRGGRKDFGRPSFGRDRGGFDRGRDSHSRPAPSNDGEVKRQLEGISLKLDQLIRSIDKLSEVKAEVKTVVKKAPAKAKAPAKKAKKK